MAFRYSFRKYQRLILGHLEQQNRYAIGGSPIRSCGPSRVGEDDHRPRAHQAIRCPPVVFAPTTTIQQQWRDEVWRRR
jgi:hypothetical protein